MNLEALLEAEKRGLLPPEKKAALLEARKRGLVPEEQFDPTAGMSTVEKLLAGAGKAFVDLGRGIGQNVGLVSRDDVSESRKLDSALMNTGAGRVGNIVGTGAALAPTALIPGVNTMLGATAVGAGTGLMMPSESTGETLTNIGTGGALAPASLAGGRAVAAGWQGLKGLVSPFFKSGQEKIAANTLQSFAANPASAAANVRAAGPSQIPGVSRTVAEVAQDPGLAQLQRTILNNPEGKALSQRMLDNSTARLNALSDIAGDEGQRALFEGARRVAAKELYDKALNSGIDPAALTPSLKGEVTKLLKRPSIVEAMRDAKKLAAEEGVKLTDKSSLRGLHYTKLALDDQIEAATRAGQGKKAEALTGTKEKLLNVLETLSSGYREARITFQEMSKPINQMDVGQYLLRKAQPPLAGGGQLGMNKAQFGRAMLEPDRTAKAATRFAGAKMEKVMTPEQLSVLKAIEKELAGVANAENLGRAVGSNTGQNMVSQNVLRQTLGPLGLPEKWSESTVLQTLMRPVQFSAKLGEPRVVEKVAESLMDPQEFLRLIAMSQQRSRMEAIAPEIARYLPAAGLLGALPTNR